MGFETDITTAVAELLDAAGVSRWDPEGIYSASAEPATYVRMTPDVNWPIVTLSTYPVAAATGPNDTVLGLQIRTRAPGRDPRPTDDLDDAVFTVLHGLSGASLGRYRITQILFQSGASLGQDGSERWGRSANYYITGPRT